MGSWYNLTGEALSNCVNSKCGQRPFPLTGMIISPQQEAEYSAKMSAWNACRENCEKQRFATQSTGYTMLPPTGSANIGQITNIAPSRDAGGQIKDTRPLEKQDGSNLELTGAPTGISKNTILIGVGVLAVVAFLAFRK